MSSEKAGDRLGTKIVRRVASSLVKYVYSSIVRPGWMSLPNGLQEGFYTYIQRTLDLSLV